MTFLFSELLGANDFALVRRHLDAGHWRRTAILSGAKVEQGALRLIARDQRLPLCVWVLVVFGAWLKVHGGLQ